MKKNSVKIDMEEEDRILKAHIEKILREIDDPAVRKATKEFFDGVIWLNPNTGAGLDQLPDWAAPFLKFHKSFWPS